MDNSEGFYDVVRGLSFNDEIIGVRIIGDDFIYDIGMDAWSAIHPFKDRDLLLSIDVDMFDWESLVANALPCFEVNTGVPNGLSTTSYFMSVNRDSMTRREGRVVVGVDIDTGTFGRDVSWDSKEIKFALDWLSTKFGATFYFSYTYEDFGVEAPPSISSCNS